MAVTGSFIGNCTLWNHNTGETDTTDWMQVEAAYSIDAVKGEQAYSVQIRARLIPNVRMNYTGLDTTLTIKVDDQSQTIIGSPSMDCQGDNGNPGPWTDWYTFKYEVSEAKSTIRMSVTVDLSAITGINSGHIGGPDSNSKPGWHYNKLTASGSVDVSGIVLGRPPVLTSLSNNNPYTNPSTGKQNGVSASVNSISVAINASDWGDPAATAYWSCDGKSGNTKSSSFSITGLTPGTSYTVTVYLQNTIGTSSSKTITIRTRHNPPVVSLSLTEIDLEQLIFSWESDKNLKSTEYKIDDGSWISLDQTGTSGTFTAQWFDPKTTHVIYFRGTSTDDLDSLLSDEKDASGTTYDRAHIIDIGECIFGLPIEIMIESESEKQLKMEIWVEGNNLEPLFEFDNIGSGDRQWIFNPTQDQLDQIYRCYPKSNTIPIHFLVTTHGEWKDWEDTQQDATLLLTGIAKTGHVGDENNVPRRVQFWVGDENNVPRRAVCWVGVDGVAQRTI